MNNVVDADPLCCCEYFDRHNERNHILACCCQCDEFDEICERLICCKTVDRKLKKEMWLTVRDRLRIPYPGGALHIGICDTFLPLFLLILSQLISAINMYCTVVVFLVLNCSMIYYRYKNNGAKYRTNFYYHWFSWSIVYLVVLFQTNVPLMEILPEENLVLVILLTVMIICFRIVHRSNQKSSLNSMRPTKNQDDDESSIGLLIPCEDNGDKDCNNVTKEIDDGEYDIWIGASINRCNYKYYILGCCLAVITFLWYSNLVITTVCHPFPVLRIFNVDLLMPDDCTDVYDEYDIALCFVGGLYAFFLSIFTFGKLTQEICFVTKDMAFRNVRSNERNPRKSCLNNWKSFLCN